ncbi:MAG: OmpA family protein [Flavobacteriaceae bacterium]
MKYIYPIIVFLITTIGYGQNLPNFEVENLNVNDSYSNFGAAYFGESDLVFSSTKGRGMTSWVNPKNQNVFYNLYKGRVKDSISLEDVRRFKPSFLSSFHESNLVFSKGLDVVYITQSNQRNGRFVEGAEGTVNLKVYKFEKDASGEWSEMIDLPFNSDNYSVAHPALSPDGKTLYVSSNRPDSFGDTDIYKIEINEDGSYGPMINLGSMVNSQHRESFPYFGDNLVLYFSSDRPGGMGGLDIYASKQISNYYSEPVSLDYPINSKEDDFSFIIKSASNTGYFSSNRAGGKGGDDIYSFRQTQLLDFKCQQLVEGQVLDQDNMEALSDVSVILLDDFGNALQSTVTDLQGNYNFVVDCNSNYSVMVNHFEYYRAEKLVNTSDLSNEVNIYNLSLEKEVIVKNEKEQLNLNTIFFEINSSYLTKDAMTELLKVVETMQKYPGMEIAIGSHTDSSAEAAYNLWLSDRRAKRTRDFIIENGIEGSRISAKGYGEQELLNKCSDNVECSEEEHAENRRSEFVIVKSEQ